MDARLRELERQWKETGGEQDREAFLRARLRQGDLTPERLHLAAYLGDPVCRSLHAEPSEAELRAALPPELFDGVAEAIEQVWTEALARQVAESTQALLAAAAELPQLRRLRPVTSMDTVGFSRCLDPPFTPTPVILPVGADLPTTFLVQAGTSGEEFLGAPTDPTRAVELLAQHLASDVTVWCGSRHELHRARTAAGGLEDPLDLDAWISPIAQWGRDPAVRAAVALARAALPICEAGDPQDSRPSQAVAAALTFLREPSDAMLNDAVAAGDHAIGSTADLAHAPSPMMWAVSLCVACGIAASDGVVVYDWPIDHVIPDAELKATVRAALIPWALGEGDPLLDE